MSFGPQKWSAAVSASTSRSTLNAHRLACLRAGGSRDRCGWCPLAKHSRGPYYSRKKVISLRTVVAPGAKAAVLKSCVLSRTGRGRFGRASRKAPCFYERLANRVSPAFRTGILSDACWSFRNLSLPSHGCFLPYGLQGCGLRLRHRSTLRDEIADELALAWHYSLRRLLYD